jgi:RNA polymerase sigma-70 factor (ECF subfamily)
LRLDAIAERMSLDAALLALPESFRVPVVLRDVADLDYAEIAEVLDVPVGTVKSRIARGRAALAAELVRVSGNSTTPSERPTGGS